jgi:hypothetical protein
MQGTRSPFKPNRTNSDPFLGSPVSRIPPTAVPMGAGGPPDEWSSSSSASANTSPGARIAVPTGEVNGTNTLQPVGWDMSRERAHSWEEVFRQLRAKGVTWQKLEMQGNQWRFECTVPHPQDPNQAREYYATAPDPLGAVQAVLRKLDGTP